jgi:hypothetical protein
VVEELVRTGVLALYELGADLLYNTELMGA